ncbi:MAG: hypothetical protein QOH82_705, partial [Mycobacterium sp.]|nr:hypothetical protein [Mycobacterium sp.]
PRLRATALGQTQHGAVELACRGQVVDGYRQMEPRNGGVENGHQSKLSRREERADLASIGDGGVSLPVGTPADH